MDLETLDEVKRSLLESISIRRFEDEIPSDKDLKFIAVAEAFRKLTAAQRIELTESVPDDKILVILSRGDRLAVLAARTGNVRNLSNALLSHAIEGSRFDYRENIRRLPLIAHVAKKIGASEKQLFQEVIEVSTPRIATLLREFIGRDEREKTIHSAGLEEVWTPQGVDFVERDPSAPRKKR